MNQPTFSGQGPGSGHGQRPVPAPTAATSGVLAQESRRLRATVVSTDLPRADLSARLPTIIDAVPTALVMIDATGRIVLVNAQTETLFGYSRVELLGERVELLVPDRYRPGHPELRTRFFAAPAVRRMGEGRDLFGLRKDGSEFPIEIGLTPVEMEGEVFVISAIVDITERKRMEGQLRSVNDVLEQGKRELERQKQALDAHAIVAITDPAGTIIYANERFCAISGYPELELLGQNHRMLNSGYHSREFFQQMYRTISSGQVWHGEIRNRAKDGSLYWVDTTIVPFVDQQGRPERYIAIRTDITAQRASALEAEAARQVAEVANRIKGDFLAVMSHEIRTPLNGVLGLVGMLMESGLRSEQLELARSLRTCGEALLTQVNDILDYSKIEAGKIDLQEEDFALLHTVDDSIILVAERLLGKDLDLGVVIAPEVPAHFLGDQSRLRQIFANLLSNAVKFTQQGGITLRIGLHPRASDDPPGCIRLACAVEDTGIGIPADKLTQLFTPFTQIHRGPTQSFGGTGLGLTISRMLVERMGGTITVDSAVGTGSTFRFDIRLQQVEEPLPPAELFSGVRVLLAVERSLQSDALAEQLANWGCATARCTPEQAPQLLCEAVVQSRPYRIALVAYSPHRESQLPLLRAVAHESKCHLLFLCRPGQTAVAGDSIELPLRPGAVKRRLHACLTGQAAPPEAPQQFAKLSGHVLVAEDNPINQVVLTDTLRRLGLTTEVAANGQEAIDAVSRRHFDIVLMDCQMPVIDGREATRRLRRLEAQHAAPRRLPIIALTASATERERQESLDAGMDDFATKPVRLAALYAILASRLPLQSAEAVTAVPPAAGEGFAARESGLFKQLAATMERADYFRLRAAVRQDFPLQDAALRAALAEAAWPQVARLAHRLTSAASALGHRALGDACRALEQRALQSDATAANVLGDTVCHHLATCLQALDRQETDAGPPHSPS